MRQLLICLGEGEPRIGNECFLYYGLGNSYSSSVAHGKILDIYADGDVLVELDEPAETSQQGRKADQKEMG
jgi:hypothetical protein